MKKSLIILATILAGMFGVLASRNVSATTVFDGNGMPVAPSSNSGGGNSAAQQARAGVDSTGTNSNTNMEGVIKTVVSVMMFILGALAVIMIIYSGVQYVISVGDSGKIQKAKNTLIYSIVGLVVAMFAYAIVNFVLDNLG